MRIGAPCKAAEVTGGPASDNAGKGRHNIRHRSRCHQPAAKALPNPPKPGPPPEPPPSSRPSSLLHPLRSTRPCGPRPHHPPPLLRRRGGPGNLTVGIREGDGVVKRPQAHQPWIQGQGFGVPPDLVQRPAGQVVHAGLGQVGLEQAADSSNSRGVHAVEPAVVARLFLLHLCAITLVVQAAKQQLLAVALEK